MDKLKVTMIGHISEEAQVSILTDMVIRQLQKEGKLPGPRGVENRAGEIRGGSSEEGGLRKEVSKRAIQL